MQATAVAVTGHAPGAGRVRRPAVRRHGEMIVVLRRLRAARRKRVTVEVQPDGVPKTGLFAEPIRVSSLRVMDPEPFDDVQRRVTFLIEIRDAEGRRCSDVAVEATVASPLRERTAQGATDLLGRIRFRTIGPAGDYAIEIRNVGAGGLRWDPDGGPRDLVAAIA